MHKQVYEKVLFHLSVFGILLSILVGFYEIIFEYVLEAAHLLFEVAEMSLDKVVEHLFETELHETQMIVFYILLTVCGVLAYFLWKSLVLLWGSINRGFLSDWTGFREAVVADWHEMPVNQRVMWVVVFVLVNSLAFFLLF